MKKIWIGVGLACALSLAGCGGGDKPAAKTDAAATPAAGGAGATPDMDNGATVTGKVMFTGDKPKMNTLDLSAVPACTAVHKGPAKSEEVVVNDNGTLKNAFVWVSAGLPADKTWAVPTTPVVITQEGCIYTPHVIGAMTGQDLDIKNADQVNHNIHPLPTVNPDYNQSQPPGSGDLTHSFPRQEVLIAVKCNVHNWMKAYIGVVSHPFFAVTGDDGTFTIKGLPPGTYTIEVVHEKYGKSDQENITVGAKDSKTVDFTIKG